LLVLRAVDVASAWRWRWLLSDEESGRPLADHAVGLDPDSDEVAAFGDLYAYVGEHASPDRWDEDEARIVARAGAWAGRVLGEAVGDGIVADAPVTVRVVVPAELEHVLGWPLELAHVTGVPLAARGEVTLVYDIAAPGGTRKDLVGEALRVLAVFSQPARTSVLALRRERYALARLIREIAAPGRAVELRVVQYGVTRDRLARIVREAPGWDVLHLSGHGTAGAFLLERADGSPDLVSAADLVGLLRPARRRVKLAVLSACESAAGTTARTLRLIGLDEQAEAVAEAAQAVEAAQPVEASGLARLPVAELGCAVVGMRYPVLDEFAIGFGEQFYGELLRAGQPVDVPVARAVPVAAGGGADGRSGWSGRGGWPVSVATPGLFGERAAGLTLPVPRGRPRLDPAEVKMERVPAEPGRFVGRAGAMAVASAALSPRSGRTIVLLHGMAGAGKTACALELAYPHQDGFGAVAFWQAPTKEGEWAGALTGLAAALEVQLGGYGFTMAGHIGTAAAVEAFVPRLRKLMADSGVLLVLDNLETLLTPDGAWRDPAWGPYGACGAAVAAARRRRHRRDRRPVGPGQRPGYGGPGPGRAAAARRPSRGVRERRLPICVGHRRGASEPAARQRAAARGAGRAHREGRLYPAGRAGPVDPAGRPGAAAADHVAAG
jgi:CHAT domain